MDGTTDKVNAHDGWTNAEGLTIAMECYTGAVEGAADLIRRWYEDVKPTVLIVGPCMDEKHSGLRCVPLTAKARAYEHTWSAPEIYAVHFLYAEADTPVWSDYKLTSPYGIRGSVGEEWRETWKNTINDDLVWLRARAIDKAHCESLLTDAVSISIDSCRPKVINMTP